MYENELKSSLKASPPGKATRKVRRKKKYVSPYRRDKYVPTVVTCVECKLPSTKGLPPFIRVNRLIEGEIVPALRHYTCPKDADKLLKLVEQNRAAAIFRYQEQRKVTYGRKWSVH